MLCCPGGVAGGPDSRSAGRGDPAWAAAAGSRRQHGAAGAGAVGAVSKSAGGSGAGEGRRGWGLEAKRQGTPPAGEGEIGGIVLQRAFLLGTRTLKTDR